MLFSSQPAAGAEVTVPIAIKAAIAKDRRQRDPAIIRDPPQAICDSSTAFGLLPLLCITTLHPQRPAAERARLGSRQMPPIAQHGLNQSECCDRRSICAQDARSERDPRHFWQIEQ